MISLGTCKHWKRLLLLRGTHFPGTVLMKQALEIGLLLTSLDLPDALSNSTALGCSLPTCKIS